MNRPRRIPVLAAVVLILVAASLVDRRERRSPPNPSEPLSGRALDAAVAQVPAAPPAGARSSAWYCSGATADPGGVAAGTVVVLNFGRKVLHGTLTVLPTMGESRIENFEVQAYSQAALSLSTPEPAPNVSAVVELDGGQAAVELAVNGRVGNSVSPCASSASKGWYFAEGVTTRDATEVLTVFNPFPEDAVVDLQFTTEEGLTTPEALTGLTVQGRSTTTVNVGEFVQRREGATASVVARRGRLVVHRLQLFDGSAGRRAVSLTLGAQAPGSVWYFPEGVVVDGITERYQIFNPSPREAEVRMSFALESGEAEPLELTVPSESRLTVIANEQTRIPRGVPHAITIESTNGVGIVAERTIDGSPPSGRSGVAITPGARLSARQWVLPLGRADGVVDEWLALHNPGTAPARVSIAVIGGGQSQPVDALKGVDLAPGQRRSIRLHDYLSLGSTPLVITATRPVIVERDMYTAHSGFTMVIGILMRP